jgi:adsorption protein B
MGDFLTSLDTLVLAMAAPISVYILVSGLDDVFIDLAWLYFTLRRLIRPTPPPDLTGPEKRIAIVIPAWQEHAVIQQMLEHNSAAIRYENYHFFVGAYPNDSLTIQAVEAAAARLPNVHLARVPHPGPTSKGDCLNWVYQHVLLSEQENGAPFDAILMHDAEDIIHPEALRYVNHYADTYGFIQIPVLALQTPLANFTHGIYCDEFAETQTRDLPVRQALGAFVPSAGVGTAITRSALDELASRNQNRVFEPDSLTEDYEMGLRLHESGCRQLFLPIQVGEESFVATREYFPTDHHTAIRQRTRWITGIALQTWQRHGWEGSWINKYWFWRDRKALLGNPLSLMTTALLIYGGLSGLWHHPDSLVIRLMPATVALLALRTLLRIGCTARIYGPALAYLAPFRILWGNWINGVATVKAVYRYTLSRIRKERLAWLKTEHQYPSREALILYRRRLGDLLVKTGALTRDQVEESDKTKPIGVRLGEHLLQLKLLTEDQLYEALSLQQQLPMADVTMIPLRIGRSLPQQVMRDRRILPFRIEPNGMAVCSPEPPDAETVKVLAGFTRLEIRFYLVPPTRFKELQEGILTRS